MPVSAHKDLPRFSSLRGPQERPQVVLPGVWRNGRVAWHHGPRASLVAPIQKVLDCTARVDLVAEHYRAGHSMPAQQLCQRVKLALLAGLQRYLIPA